MLPLKALAFFGKPSGLGRRKPIERNKFWKTISAVAMKIEDALEIVRAIRPLEQRRAPPKATFTALPGSRENPYGFVYFAYCAGRIKIGFTTDVANRMSGLATSCPFPVYLLLTIAGDLEDERAMHQRFETDRVNLEWFAASADLLAFLENTLCADGAVVLTNAQFESRAVLTECAASVVNATGGDDGRDVEAKPWPGFLRAMA